MKIVMYLVGWVIVTYVLFYLIGFVAIPVVIGLQIISSIMKGHKELKQEREVARQAVEQARHEELLQALKDSKHKD